MIIRFEFDVLSNINAKLVREINTKILPNCIHFFSFNLPKSYVMSQKGANAIQKTQIFYVLKNVIGTT